MKKIISFVLALVMVFSLSGCGAVSVKPNKPVLKPDGETYISDVEKLLPEPKKYFKSVDDEYIVTNLEDDNSSYQVAVINPKREEYEAYLEACIGKVFAVELDTSVIDGFKDQDSRVFVDENHWYELGGVWMEEYGNVYAMFVVAVYETTNDPIVPLSQNSGTQSVEETPEPTPEIEINWEAVHGASLGFAALELFSEGDYDKLLDYLDVVDKASDYLDKGTAPEDPFLKAVYNGLFFLCFIRDACEVAEIELTDEELKTCNAIILTAAYGLLSDGSKIDESFRIEKLSEKDKDLLRLIWENSISESSFERIF